MSIDDVEGQTRDHFSNIEMVTHKINKENTHELNVLDNIIFTDCAPSNKY